MRSAPGGPWRVVVDPIDGSVNAKRGIPFFSLSVAVADGPTMGDVVFGYVYDFGTGEEWTAERGRGARLDGEPLGGVGPKDPIEILAFEGTTSATIAASVAAVEPLAQRLRVMGSLALSLCQLASGRVDAVCSLKAARSVDIAARSCSSASRVWRSSCPTHPRSTRPRSTSVSARGSWPLRRRRAAPSSLPLFQFGQEPLWRDDAVALFDPVTEEITAHPSAASGIVIQPARPRP